MVTGVQTCALPICVLDEDLVPENFQTLERLTAFIESRRMA